MPNNEKPMTLKESVIAICVFVPLGGILLWLLSHYDKKQPWESAKVIGGLLWEIFKLLGIFGLVVWAGLASFFWIKNWFSERPELRNSPIFRGFYRLTILASVLPFVFGFAVPIIFTEMGMEDKIAWVMGCLAVAAMPWVLFGVSVFVVDGFREKKLS